MTFSHFFKHLSINIHPASFFFFTLNSYGHFKDTNDRVINETTKINVFQFNRIDLKQLL